MYAIWLKYLDIKEWFETIFLNQVNDLGRDKTNLKFTGTQACHNAGAPQRQGWCHGTPTFNFHQSKLEKIGIYGFYFQHSISNVSVQFLVFYYTHINGKITHWHMNVDRRCILQMGSTGNYMHTYRLKRWVRHKGPRLLQQARAQEGRVPSQKTG